MPNLSKALSPLRSITFTHLKNSARFLTAKFPTVLAPSFLQQRNGDGSSNPKVPPTAWLDGMRGIAAFLVYIRHFGAIHHPNIQAGFGSSEENTYITQLPFIRLLVSGPAMVALFFIISGYALSWGPLRTIHAGTVDKSFERLSSATFRRGMRLYLPGIISTFIIMICISLGMYNRGQKAFESDVDMPGFHEPQPPMWLKDPFSVQFWDWIRCSWAWINIWHSTGHAYNPHLWTLSVEFRSSIALFMALLALARTRAVYRLAGLASFVIYCYYTDAWAEWLFFAGATLAQLKLLQDQYESALLGDIKLEEDDSNNGCSTSLSTLDIVRVVIFVAGLYLLSAPDNGLGKLIYTIWKCSSYIQVSIRSTWVYVPLRNAHTFFVARKLAILALSRRILYHFCRLLYLHAYATSCLR